MEVNTHKFWFVGADAEIPIVGIAAVAFVSNNQFQVISRSGKLLFKALPETVSFSINNMAKITLQDDVEQRLSITPMGQFPNTALASKLMTLLPERLVVAISKDIQKYQADPKTHKDDLDKLEKTAPINNELISYMKTNAFGTLRGEQANAIADMLVELGASDTGRQAYSRKSIWVKAVIYLVIIFAVFTVSIVLLEQ